MAKPQGEKSETIEAIMERARQFLNQLNGGPPADGTPAASSAPATSGPTGASRRNGKGAGTKEIPAK